MVDLFKSSMEEVFNRSFGLNVEPDESKPLPSGYAAEIPFSDGRRTYRATVWLERPVLEKLAEILLCENDPDEETLRDLTSEVANFIVGHAKMEASDRKLPYEMETPRFTGIEPLHPTDHTLHYRIDGRNVALQLKETDE
ncbi:chemotaxis protein CheX [Hydrogenimonas sp. SS33]|uniref:chemotaxis protein CheX n=1 Tax=Hydrogenimonas leucolamina TaxID=2954236 RepID=UPI00336BF4FB